MKILLRLMSCTLFLVVAGQAANAQTFIYTFGGNEAGYTDRETTTSYEPHNFAYGGTVTFPAAGTVNQLGLKGRTGSGTPTVKIALYDTSGNLVAQSTLTLTSGTLGWVDSSTFTPVAVSATSYYIMYSASTTNALYGADNTNEGHNSTIAHASFPANPATINVGGETDHGYSGRAQFTASAVPALVQSATGTATTATISPAFSVASTSGNLNVCALAADDYNGTPPANWTQSSEMEQQGFHGAYLFWKISTGETNLPSITLDSATNSAWACAEFSGVDATPYDGSQGVITNTSGTSQTTDPITPTAGERLIVAMIGGSLNTDLSGVTLGSWTNSFTGIASIGSGGAGTNDLAGLAYQVVTADGSTAYSTGATYSGGTTMQSRSGLIIAFKAAAGGGGGGGSAVPVITQVNP